MSSRIAAAEGIASSSHSSQAVTCARYGALLGCVLTHYRGDSAHYLRLPVTRCHGLLAVYLYVGPLALSSYDEQRRPGRTHVVSCRQYRLVGDVAARGAI